MNDPEIILDKLCDEYRAARLNVVYYGERLVRLQRWNSIFEIAIAIGTSGVVASLALFQSQHGKATFGIIAAVSAFVAILKPIFGLSKQIERVSKLWSGWNSHFFALKSALDMVYMSHAVTPAVEAEYRSALTRAQELAGADDPMPNRRALLRIWDQVNVEIPPESLPALAA